MQKSLKAALYSILCGAVVATTLPTEILAGPMSAPDPSKVSISAPVEKAYYRRGWGGYYGGYSYPYGSYSYPYGSYYYPNYGYPY